MIGHHEAKRLAGVHLQAEGGGLTPGSATRDSRYGLWIVSYHDLEEPAQALTGGALVVTDDGEVHDVGSAPGAIDDLMERLGRPLPLTPPLDAAYEREGEGLALLADLDPDEAEGLAAYAASQQPWPEVLGAEMGKPYFRELERWVIEQRRAGEVYPPHADVYAAFRLTPLDQVRVVLLGQDPYPNPGEAHGLCFSVGREVVRLPRSLRNIHVAMRADGLNPPDHGDLTGWAKQGVLLLNTALTVRRREPNSHRREWQPFTDEVIRIVNALERPVVFVLWGAEAQKRKRLITNDHHHVVEAPHPASRTDAQARFRAAHTFSRVNALLDEQIDWERL